MNVKRQHKFKGAIRTQKNGGNKKPNPSTKIGNNRTYKRLHTNCITGQAGAGWGKKKSDAENQAMKDAKKAAKKAANNAARLAKEEKKKLAADAKAKKAEAEKAKKAEEQKKKKEAKKGKKSDEETNKPEKKAETTEPEKKSVEEEPEKKAETTESEKKAETPEPEKTQLNLESELQEESTNGPVLNLENKGANVGESESDDMEENINPEQPAINNSGTTDQAAESAKSNIENQNVEPEKIGQAEETETSEAETDEAKQEELEESEKPWYKKLGSRIAEKTSEFMEGAKNRPWGTIKSIIKSPYTLGQYTVKKTTKTMSRFGKWAANKAEKYSPIRQVQRFKTWTRKSAAAKSNVKFDKYIEQQVESQQKIDKLLQNKADIQANNDLSDDEKAKQLEKLNRQIKQEKAKKATAIEKSKTWATRKKKTENEMTRYAETLAKKSAPVKEKMAEKIKENQQAFLTSPKARENISKQVGAEVDAEVDAFRASQITALEQNTDYQNAKQIIQKCPTGSEPKTEECQNAELLIKTTDDNLAQKVEAQKQSIKTAKEKDINKRILKTHGMEIIGKDLFKLTRAMRLPDAISTPGTPEHTELQEKINAHIEEKGVMPNAAEISRMVTGTAFDQTLSNTTKDMAIEIKNSMTSRQSAFRDSATALANISHPMAKTTVVKSAIDDFLAKQPNEIAALRRPLTQNLGESPDDFNARKNARDQNLKIKETVFRTVKQMLAANKPLEYINTYISRYNTEFKDTITAKANNLTKRKNKYKAKTKANNEAVQTYYKAEMASLGYYNTDSGADPSPNPRLVAFARNYYNGTIPLDKSGQMTPRQIKIALDNYKNNYLPDRIANNPFIMDNLPKPLIQTTTQFAVKSSQPGSSSDLVATNPLLTNTKPNTNGNTNPSKQEGNNPDKNNPSTATTQIHNQNLLVVQKQK